jgi:hypothetical protein
VFGLKVRQRAFVTLQRKTHIAVSPVTMSHAQLKVNKLWRLDFLKRPLTVIVLGLRSTT